MFSLWELQLWSLTTTCLCSPHPVSSSISISVSSSSWPTLLFFSFVFCLISTTSPFLSSHVPSLLSLLVSWASIPSLHMSLSSLLSLSQIRVSQLQVDGGWQRRFPRASKSLYTPRFSSFWRHLDETSGQFWQTQADQQWTGWSRTCESKNPIPLFLPLPLFALELTSPRLWQTDKIKAFI